MADINNWNVEKTDESDADSEIVDSRFTIQLFIDLDSLFLLSSMQTDEIIIKIFPASLIDLCCSQCDSTGIEKHSSVNVYSNHYHK